jgi:hypothetical protein
MTEGSSIPQTETPISGKCIFSGKANFGIEVYGLTGNGAAQAASKIL